MNIADVYIWQNDMTMVFDENGQQMDHYQGPWRDVGGKILADAPCECRFFRGVYQVYAIPITREQLRIDNQCVFRRCQHDDLCELGYCHASRHWRTLYDRDFDFDPS